MSRNGKDKFYRTLNLDEHEKNALRIYNEVKKKVNKSNKKEDKWYATYPTCRRCSTSLYYCQI